MLARIGERIRDERWLTLTLELALVVAGILLAFQLDRAYQASQDRDLEQRYLTRLAEDLRRDSAELAQNIRRTESRLGQVRLLETARRDPSVAAADPEAFVEALEKVTWRSVAPIATSTYDELRSTGRTVLLRSETLRRDLADYYASIPQNQRLGLGEDDQDKFRAETLGLLSGEQLAAVEDPDGYPLRMSPDEAAQVARGFATRTGAHAWMGRLTKYQVLMQRLSRSFLERNAALLAEVDALRVGGG